MEFEWDNQKAAYHFQKHGVAFSEALKPKERKLYGSGA